MVPLRSVGLQRVLTVLVASILAGCGSGGGSDAFVGATGGSGGGGAFGGVSGGNTGSGWTAGVFEPAASFKNLCLNPRVGVNPATSGPYPDAQGTTLDENNWLRSWSNDTYLWYDEITDIDPGGFNDPIDYFARLRTFRQTDSGNDVDRFHFTYDTDEWQALSQSGVTVGYGATWVFLTPAPPRELAVAYTDPNTPAGDAGLARGARILSIDGIDVVNDNTQAAVDTINAALYPAASGESYLFEVQDLGASGSYFVQLTAEEVSSTPVQHTQTVTSPGGATVGYLLFNDHIATAEQGLVAAFETLDAVPGGVDDLVIDLRYNSGGFLVIASQLAYMIAGPTQTAGLVFENTQFNDQHPVTNPVTGNPIVPLPFIGETVGLSTTEGLPLPSLDLSRVFVLTGGNTCSASEAIINGLRGAGIEVIQIGQTTCGKPYGFYPTDNCGTTYFTVQFRGVNNLGFGEYPNGFTPSGGSVSGDTTPPGCVVADDFDHSFADPAEARLAAALYYRDNGSCPSLPVTVSSKANPGAVGSAPAAFEPLVRKPQGLDNRVLGF